jgi:hypothetical protein
MIRYNREHGILVQYAPRIVEVHFSGRDGVYKLPTPYVLLLLSYSRNVDRENVTYEFNGAEIYASPEPITSLNQVIYYLPFGNLYSNGQVCWGDDFPVDESDSLTAVNMFYDSFFGMPFNNDLDVIAANGMMKFDQILDLLDGKEVFPSDILVAATDTIGMRMRDI